MTRNQLLKRLSAFGDGALANGRKARIARALERDPELSQHLARQRALGRLVRESWNDGPPAPPTDYLIAALRPQLAQVDRERRAQPLTVRLIERLRSRGTGWLRPAPLGLSAATAFLIALALLPRAQLSGTTATATWLSPQRAAQFFEPAQSASREPRHAPYAPAAFPWNDSAAGIYDLAPGERPAMLFHSADGTTMLWLLEEDDLSFDFANLDRWG